MDRTLKVPLGVVIAREKINDPWREYAWRPVSAFMHAAAITEWRELHRSENLVHYHAATLDLELHAKETAGYLVNLSNGVPSLYVVLREQPESGSEQPVHVHLITASPFDVQAYGAIESEIIDRIEMPETLVEITREFVAVHHVEEKFVKRKRVTPPGREAHMFGQEPVFERRDRPRAGAPRIGVSQGRMRTDG